MTAAGGRRLPFELIENYGKETHTKNVKVTSRITLVIKNKKVIMIILAYYHLIKNKNVATCICI